MLGISLSAPEKNLLKKYEGYTILVPMLSQEILKKQTLLEDLEDTELKRIGSVIKEIPFKKGETVFKEKDDAEGVFLVHSGKVEISKITPDGWKQTLAVLTKGSFLGELSIIEHRRHEANAGCPGRYPHLAHAERGLREDGE